MIEKLRTPDSRFENLPDFAFKPKYIDNLTGYSNLRMHYLDIGTANEDEVFLCLHGEPTWCFLYRKMIKVFQENGYRSIAPDFFGFGRSDKPIEDSIYTFDFHRNALIEFILALDLKNIVLVCQDWGGVIGLTIPHIMPDRFKRLIIMNTGFANGIINEEFLRWKEYNNIKDDLNIAQMIKSWMPTVSESEALAYEAPFPDKRYKAGVRSFPNLLPVNKEMPGVEVSKQAINFWKTQWEGDTFMAIGMKDEIVGPSVMIPIQNTIRNCSEPLEIEYSGHFVPELGDIVAMKALEYFSRC
ncbi:MAG: haloalkane dehalogenase [Ekhidna sp.]